MPVQDLGPSGPRLDEARRAVDGLRRWFGTWWPFGVARRHPDVRTHLLREEGEDLADVVHYHWVRYLPARLAMLGGVLLGVSVLFYAPRFGALPVFVGLVLVVGGWLRILSLAHHVFVITNMRVFLITGVLTTRKSMLPLTRLLDITVVKPAIGRVLGYGHFDFESAAKDGKFDQVRWVPHPDERDRKIQEVIQRAGLRRVWVSEKAD